MDQKPYLHIPVTQFASVSDADDYPRADVAVDPCGTAAAAGGKPGKWIDCVRNVMVHAQKRDFVFRRNGRVHLNRRGRQFSRLLAAEVCASAVVMLDTPCFEVV